MSSLDQLRQKHIESLAQFEPIRIDSNTYQIPCHLAAITVILVIKLPTRYPEVKPTIEISNTDVHHSLIQNGVIDHQRLRTWNLNSSLARLVEDILMGFTLSPPVFISKYSLQTTLEGLNPLDHKTDSEVEELLNDENCFAEYFFELPEVSPSKQFNDELLTKNAREAEQNLNRESEIKDLKERVAKLQASNIKHRSELDSLLTVQQKELLVFGINLEV
jgi:hypothetical protein